MLYFDYDSLSVLAAVVREGSFDAAARSLNVTQSAVSQRIRQLEEKVGSVLVVRGRPCVATEAGLQLCRHVDQVSLLQHELSERMNTMGGREGAAAVSIRIAVNNDSLATWFPSVMKRAADELNVRFDIIPDDQEHTERSLKSGDALAGVTSLETPVQGCQRVSLGSMNYIAVASKQFYADHFPDGVSPRSLSEAPCVAFDRKDTIQDQWMQLCFGAAIPLSLHLMPSYEGYLSCCRNGTAWGLVSSIAGRPLIERGELIDLSPGKAVKVSLHWQASTLAGETLRRLGEIVLERAKIELAADQFRLN